MRGSSLGSNFSPVPEMHPARGHKLERNLFVIRRVSERADDRSVSWQDSEADSVPMEVYSGPDLTFAVDNELPGGKFLQSHGTVSVEFCSANADFSAQTKLASVVEPG